MRPVATDVTRSLFCVSVCLSVCWARGWAVQKRAELIKMSLGADSCGSKDPCIRLGSISSHGNGHLWEWHVSTCSNVTTRGECDCPAHAADKCIFHHERWQECGVASCQIALDTCYYYYYLFLLQTVLGWMSFVSIGCVLGYVICFAIGLGTWRLRCDQPTPVYIGICVICYATLILKT